jgi:hypothetical protein
LRTAGIHRVPVVVADLGLSLVAHRDESEHMINF